MIPFSVALKAARSGTPPGRRTVNGGLTRKRPKRTVEASDYAAMMRCLVRAHGRRVADIDEAVATAVRASRARHQRSWAEIARATGTSRQAAQQRWGRP